MTSLDSGTEVQTGCGRGVLPSVLVGISYFTDALLNSGRLWVGLDVVI